MAVEQNQSINDIIEDVNQDDDYPRIFNLHDLSSNICKSSTPQAKRLTNVDNYRHVDAFLHPSSNYNTQNPLTRQQKVGYLMKKEEEIKIFFNRTLSKNRRDLQKAVNLKNSSRNNILNGETMLENYQRDILSWTRKIEEIEDEIEKCDIEIQDIKRNCRYQAADWPFMASTACSPVDVSSFGIFLVVNA